MNKKEIENVTLVTGMQQSMLYRARAEPNSGHYVEQLVFEFEHFNEGAMLSALNTLIVRRSALRSFFVWREQEQARLITLNNATIKIDHLSQSPIELLIQKDRKMGLSLHTAPMMRFSLCETEKGTTQCIWSLHHAIVDGWSIVILQDELLSLYKQQIGGTSIATDFVEPTKQVLKLSMDNRWDRELIDAPEVKLLEVVPGSFTKTNECFEISENLDGHESARIMAWCKKQKITFSTYIHCAWSLLLAHISGCNDVLFGSIDSGRSHIIDGENLVGLYMHLKPIRTKIDETLTCSEFVQGFQNRQWYLSENIPPSPDELARKLDRHSDEPLFDMILIVQNYPKSLIPEGIGLLKLKGYEQADAPLILSVGNSNNLELLFRYQQDFISDSVIDRLAKLFSILLIEMASCIEKENISSLYDRFSQKTGVSVVGNTPQFPGKRCIDYFLEQVQAKPNAIALLEDESISYLSLSKIAETIRNSLINFTINSGDVIALHLPRSKYFVAAMLAVQSQDACYLPLNQDYPPQLLDSILKDSGACIVITNQFMSFSIDTINISTNIVDRTLSISRKLISDDMCLMYTSGTTGDMKGVYISHNAVANRLLWMYSEFPFEDDEVCCIRTPISFVDSISEIFLPLCSGVPGVIIPSTSSLNLNELLLSLKEHRVSRISLTPSLLEALLETIEELKQETELNTLKYCTVSGEGLNTAVANYFRNLLPKCRLINLYGCTEVTADATFFEVEEAQVWENSIVSIGQPISGTSINIENHHGRSLPAGVIGELVVAGTPVSRGYRHQEKPNRENFISGRFRTGDLVHIEDNGDAHYVGRKDRIIKIRGQRVEPGAIESVLLQLDGICDARVIKSGEVLLAAYVGIEYDISELRLKLLEKLPNFYVPQQFTVFDSIPRLVSGKTDYNKLEEMLSSSSVALRQSEELTIFEKQLAQTILPIWQELLPEEKITIESHFFNAGGHSLSAMRMIARVERTLGFAVAIPLLVENPILGNFAIAICNCRVDFSKTEIINLNRKRSICHTTVFCLHGDGFNLESLVGAGYAVYWISQWAIRLQLSRKPSILAYETIENIANRYLHHVQSSKVDGQIIILASCGAAVIALEVAQQLSKLGREPVQLILMDLPRGELSAPVYKRIGHRYESSWLKSVYGYVFRIFGGESFKKSHRLKAIERKIKKGFALTDIEARNYTDLLLNMALSNYKPRPYDGSVDLVFSGRWRRGIDDPGTTKIPKFWEKYLLNVTAKHFSPAKDHKDLLDKQGAEFISRILQSN